MSRGPFQLRIGGPAAASLLINALLVAALLNLGMGHRDRRVEAPALTVLSLAVTKGVATGEEEAEAAAQVQPMTEFSPPSPQLTTPDQPPIVETVHIKPQPVASPPTLPAFVPARMVTPAESPAPARAEPAVQQAVPASSSPARKGAVDGLNVSAPSGNSRSYAAKVRSWLYAHKIYPRRARMRREEGSVQVRFVLDRAGMLIEGIIVHGSGHSTLDEEAVAMMRRASPFPKAPSDLAGERIEFSAPIEFILPV